MIKKLLLILFISVTTIVSSQEKSISNLSAAPNPFNISTQITFTSSKTSNVIFTIINVLGKTVHKKVFKAKKGLNNIPFSKGNLNTGVYIYSLQNETKIISKRFVIK